MLRKITSILFGHLIRDLEKFRGIHKGESCYIFGDGISIKWFDLTSFGNLPAICVGLLPFHKDFNQLDVRYCAMIEPWLFVPKYFRPINPKITQYRMISKEYESVIKNHPEKQFIVHLSNCLSLSGENVNYIFRKLPKSGNKTDDLLQNYECFRGSFDTSLMLAYFLGFKKIYLVGFDSWTLQLPRARGNHWYNIGQGVFFEPTDFATELLDALRTEVDINTISYDRQSKNVNCISYEAFTGKPPVFKENYELLSEYHLKVLATYPGNIIFPE